MVLVLVGLMFGPPLVSRMQEMVLGQVSLEVMQHRSGGRQVLTISPHGITRVRVQAKVTFLTQQF